MSINDNWIPWNASVFGAKGDGVTDDTAAIQAAINYNYAMSAISTSPQDYPPLPICTTCSSPVKPGEDQCWKCLGQVQENESIDDLLREAIMKQTYPMYGTATHSSPLTINGMDVERAIKELQAKLAAADVAMQAQNDFRMKMIDDITNLRPMPNERSKTWGRRLLDLLGGTS